MKNKNNRAVGISVIILLLVMLIALAYGLLGYLDNQNNTDDIINNAQQVIDDASNKIDEMEASQNPFYVNYKEVSYSTTATGTLIFDNSASEQIDYENDSVIPTVKIVTNNTYDFNYSVNGVEYNSAIALNDIDLKGAFNIVVNDIDGYIQLDASINLYDIISNYYAEQDVETPSENVLGFNSFPYFKMIISCGSYRVEIPFILQPIVSSVGYKTIYIGEFEDNESTEIIYKVINEYDKNPQTAQALGLGKKLITGGVDMGSVVNWYAMVYSVSIPENCEINFYGSFTEVQTQKVYVKNGTSIDEYVPASTNLRTVNFLMYVPNFTFSNAQISINDVLNSVSSVTMTCNLYSGNTITQTYNATLYKGNKYEHYTNYELDYTCYIYTGYIPKLNYNLSKIIATVGNNTYIFNPFTHTTQTITSNMLFTPDVPATGFHGNGYDFSCTNEEIFSFN